MVPMSKYYSLNNPTFKVKQDNTNRLDIIRKQYGKILPKPVKRPLGLGATSY